MAEIALPWTVFPLFFLIAALYASVGQGGASGYLALFALFGIASPAVPPVALALNIMVATLSFLVFRKGGHFSARMFAPFAVASVPAAFLGALIPLSASVFSQLLAAALVAAALMTFKSRDKGRDVKPVRPETLWLYGVPTGLALGLLSGMIGLGGGIFLAPVIILSGWGTVKNAAALSGAFIMVNSISGLGGHILKGNFPAGPVLFLSAAVVAGGLIGAIIGAGRIPDRILQFVLAGILLAGAVKMMIG